MNIVKLLGCLLGSVLLLQSCLQDSCSATRTFAVYEPVYKSASEIRVPIESIAPRPLKHPGKMYFFNDLIFINEINKGFHVVDNSNPKAPQNKAFVTIPGNVDIAVKGQILYADNYMDLLALDISEPTQPKLLSRQEEVFSKIPFDSQRGYLIDYERTEQTEDINCDDPNFNQGWFWRNDRILVDATFENFGPPEVFTNGGGNQATGVAGSLARFGIYDNFLYVIDQWMLDVFDISVPQDLDFVNTVQVGWGIETLFPYKDKLFIGAADGLYIFDNEEPTTPRQLSKFNHARACDPVVVNETTAYVTLRDGTECEGFNNQLDIVNIKDLTNPILIASHPMEHPHGLALKGETVFICEGEFGLKAFNVANPNEIEQLDHEVFATYDAISLSSKNLLIVIGADGLYQYDSSDPTDLKRLSHLPVEK